MASIFELLVDLEKHGVPVSLCTIISTRGSAPRHEGSKMLVTRDGRLAGTVGGGEIENRVIQEGIQSLVDGRTRRQVYNMVDPTTGDAGVCGGTVEVYVEPILPKPLLLIIGGGHVGQSVAHLGKWLGFRVAVSDDREEFCTAEANPDADILLPVPMAEIPTRLEITPQTYIVLTTRGVIVDVPGLPALLDTPAAYIGVIGSKRRWLTTRKEMLEAGVADEKINRVHSPLGLELKAETPEEIAVSIMAEIIMLRNGGDGSSMKLSI